MEEAAGSNDSQEEGDKTADEEAVFLYAPDCIYKDGRYYLYFVHRMTGKGWLFRNSRKARLRILCSCLAEG